MTVINNNVDVANSVNFKSNNKKEVDSDKNSKTDKKMKTSTKLMIGATALAAVVVGGLAIKKGFDAKKAEKVIKEGENKLNPENLNEVTETVAETVVDAKSEAVKLIERLKNVPKNSKINPETFTAGVFTEGNKTVERIIEDGGFMIEKIHTPRSTIEKTYYPSGHINEINFRRTTRKPGAKQIDMRFSDNGNPLQYTLRKEAKMSDGSDKLYSSENIEAMFQLNSPKGRFARINGFTWDGVSPTQNEFKYNGFLD